MTDTPESESEQYRNGYIDGYKSGLGDGRAQGYNDAKHRTYLAVKATPLDPNSNKRLTEALVANVGKQPS